MFNEKLANALKEHERRFTCPISALLDDGGHGESD